MNPGHKPTGLSTIGDRHLKLLLKLTRDAGTPQKEERRRERIEERKKPVLGSCNRKLLLATICSSTRFFSPIFIPTLRAPIGKKGQVPLMSNLFQSSRVWA